MKRMPVMLISVIFLAAAGCLSPEMRNLARLAENRKQTQACVERQEEQFARLKHDIESRELKTGVPIEEIISKYGEPIFSKDRDYKGRAARSLLYRRPVKFFSTDLVYLYFDKDSFLIGWEVQQA